MNIDENLKALDEYLESDDFKEFCDSLNKRKITRLDRYLRMDQFFATLTDGKFNSLMDRLIDEHDDALRDYWLRQSIEPVLTNKMDLMYSYAFHSSKNKDAQKHFDMYATGFSDEFAEYRGYVFHRFYGQGIGHKIHKNNEEVFGGW